MKYDTKFSRITLSIGYSPEDYLILKLLEGLQPMQIYQHLKTVAKAHKLKMVDKHTIYYWIKKINGNGSSVTQK